MDELTSRAVRISREPFEYVDEHTVHAVLTASPEAYISFIDRSLRFPRGSAWWSNQASGSFRRGEPVETFV